MSAVGQKFSQYLVLGGGISGLSSAFYLSKKLEEVPRKHGLLTKPINIIERSDKFGGWVRSNTDVATNALVEYGPRSLRPKGVSGENTLDLIQKLGISESDIIKVGPSHTSAKRLLYFNDKLTELPSSLLSVVSTGIGRQIASRVLLEPFASRQKRPIPVLEHNNNNNNNNNTNNTNTNNNDKNNKNNSNNVYQKSGVEDESVHSFFTRRFGDYVANNLASALCHGIYAGDSKQLSIQSCFSVLSDAEARGRGSVVLGMLKKSSPPAGSSQQPSFIANYDRNWLEKFKTTSLISFKKGLETLPNALVEQFKASDSSVGLYPNSHLKSIEMTDDKQLKVEYVCLKTGKTETFTSAQVISALPPKSLASVLKASKSFSLEKESQKEELVNLLNSIQSVTVGTVTFLFDAKAFKLPTPGFGYLVPASQSSNVIGVIFDSCVFEGHQSSSLVKVTAMMGGHLFRGKFGDPNSVSTKNLEELALKDIYLHLNISPSVQPVSVHSSILHDCIPQPTVGHGSKVAKIKNLVRELFDNKLHLVGAAIGGVSVNDCIYHSRVVVNDIISSNSP